MSENNNKMLLRCIALPLVFLTVALGGGLRFSAETGAFIFLRPELVCLILSAVLFLIFYRSGLIRIDEWLGSSFSTAQNLAGIVTLITLFTATIQIFNSLLPEKGMAFWIIGLFFFWTLWNSYLAELSAKRVLYSTGGQFGLAFVIKYLVLANLATSGETWAQKIFEGLIKEASFGLLDLPKFAPATGYVQFFTLTLYLIGLALLSSISTNGSKAASDKVSSETTS